MNEIIKKVLLKAMYLTCFIYLALEIIGCSLIKPHQIEDHKICPLCGMYPARYLTFQCQIVFSDGSYEAFDSPAGLLVYLMFSDKTGITSERPTKIFFRNYLDGAWIEAKNTIFVVGTEIMGPMGLDFLPVKSGVNAEQLKSEAQGALVIHFNQVDRQFLTKAASSNWVHFLARKIILE